MAARLTPSNFLGRKAAPTDVKLARGVRKSRIDLSVTDAPAAMPPKPAGLAPAVSAAWDTIAAHVELTRICVADGASVRAWAESIAALDSLFALYHESGARPVVRGRSGEVAMSPILAAIDKVRAGMLATGRELGALPSTRAGVRVPPKPVDAFSAFLDARAPRPS